MIKEDNFLTEPCGKPRNGQAKIAARPVNKADELTVNTDSAGFKLLQKTLEANRVVDTTGMSKEDMKKRFF